MGQKWVNLIIEEVNFLENLAYGMGTSPAQTPGQSPNPFIALLPFILMFVIFYFLLIAPQRKKQKEHSNMLAKLKKNDEVVTTGGIYGVVVNVKDNSVTLKVDDNVKIEVQKSAITFLRRSGE